MVRGVVESVKKEAVGPRPASKTAKGISKKKYAIRKGSSTVVWTISTWGAMLEGGRCKARASAGKRLSAKGSTEGYHIHYNGGGDWKENKGGGQRKDLETCARRPPSFPGQREIYRGKRRTVQKGNSSEGRKGRRRTKWEDSSGGCEP